MTERELNIPASFRRFREKFGLTKTAAADAMGIRPSSYHEYEQTGKGNNPTIKTLYRLAKTFNVSIDYLVGLTDDPTPNWNNAVEKTAEPVPLPEKSSPESDAISLTERISILEERLEKLERRVGV